MTVTCNPRARQEAATSRPMNPAPTIATRVACVEFPAQRDSVVQTAENEQTRPGRNVRKSPDARARCDDQPVVVSERATGQRDAFGAEIDRRSARTPRRMSSASAWYPSFLRKKVWSGSQVPWSTCFESGGRDDRDDAAPRQ